MVRRKTEMRWVVDVDWKFVPNSLLFLSMQLL
jgi:hypothetical protein